MTTAACAAGARLWLGVRVCLGEAETRSARDPLRPLGVSSGVRLRWTGRRQRREKRHPTKEARMHLRRSERTKRSSKRGLGGMLNGRAGGAAAIAGALIAIGVAPFALAAGSSREARAAGIGATASKALRGGIHNPP